MKVGQKVVCINDEVGWLSGEKGLVKGEIYIVLWTDGRNVQVTKYDAAWDKSRFLPITKNWFRVFGYGLSWTNQPRFSHRMGLKGFKLFGLYFDLLKPYKTKER